MRSICLALALAVACCASNLEPSNARADLFIGGDRFYLPLENPRGYIAHIPMARGADFSADDSRVSVKKTKNGFEVRYDGAALTLLSPEHVEYSNLSFEPVAKLDGEEVQIAPGSVVAARESIEIMPKEGVRVNVIGYSSNLKNESGVRIALSELDARFAVDRDGKIFRVEFYEEGARKYIGMFLVDFSSKPQNIPELELGKQEAATPKLIAKSSEPILLRLTLDSNAEVKMRKSGEDAGRGKAALIMFFSEDCKPCAAQAKLLELLREKYQEHLRVASVTVGDENGRALAKMVCGAENLPYILLVDSRGELIKDYSGLVPVEMLEYDVKTLLN